MIPPSTTRCRKRRSLMTASSPTSRRRLMRTSCDSGTASCDSIAQAASLTSTAGANALEARTHAFAHARPTPPRSAVVNALRHRRAFTYGDLLQTDAARATTATATSSGSPTVHMQAASHQPRNSKPWHFFSTCTRSTTSHAQAMSNAAQQPQTPCVYFCRYVTTATSQQRTARSSPRRDKVRLPSSAKCVAASKPDATKRPGSSKAQ